MSADLAQFLDGLARSVGLVAYAVAIGGVVWGIAVLRPWRTAEAGSAAAARTCLSLVAASAAVVTVCHFLQIAAKAQFIAAGLQIQPFPEFFRTRVFQAHLARALLAAALVAVVLWLQRRPASGIRWGASAAIAAVLAVAGAWLVHGASRLGPQATLMTLTVAHQMAGAVWAGGVVHLVLLRRAGARDVAAAAFWPEAFARFPALGASALAILLATGITLTIVYVASWEGLVGTAYGSVLVAKWVLLAAALGLAAANFMAGRRWRRQRRTDAGRGLARAEGTTMPPPSYFAEAESIVLAVVLFAAAALAALPPSTDITEQRASPAEVVQSFAPRMPQLASPTLAEEQAASAEPEVVARLAESAEEQWSDYNHNVSGLILLAIALVALLERTGKAAWARHWPLGFVALAAFVLFRSDPSGWPLAPGVGLLESFGKASWVQHKIAGLLPIPLGIMEWRARNVSAAAPWMRYVFPGLSVGGGLLLLTHAHGAFEIKGEYLTQVSHTAMGTLAVLMGAARWLEIRAGGPIGRWVGAGAIVALNLIALILLFYREPLG